MIGLGKAHQAFARDVGLGNLPEPEADVVAALLRIQQQVVPQCVGLQEAVGR